MSTIDADRFLVVQRFTAMINRYEVSTVAEDGRSPDRPVAFVEQARLKIKEEITAYADDSKSAPLFRIKARQVFDPSARYDVTSPDGQRIGVLGKRFGRSLLRSTWHVFDGEENEIALAQERSVAVAIARRAADFIGDIALLANLIPFHFDVLAGDRRIGGYDRIVGLRDRYVLDLSEDTERVIDRRLGVALAIALDALQAR